MSEKNCCEKLQAVKNEIDRLIDEAEQHDSLRGFTVMEWLYDLKKMC